MQNSPRLFKQAGVSLLMFISFASLTGVGTGVVAMPSAFAQPAWSDRPAEEVTADEATALRATAPQTQSYRVQQARELLGPQYEQSVAKVGEMVPDMQKFVRKCTEKSLRARWRRQTSRISLAIMQESHRYEFDPVFVMSVIDNESRWRPNARGRHGEIGLMQLKPSTARWIARMYGIPFKGKKTLRDPAMNIRIGTAYMDFLREEFDGSGALYVSAYNAGLGTIHRAIRHQRLPSQAYLARIMRQYLRYYSALRDEQQADATSDA